MLVPVVLLGLGFGLDLGLNLDLGIGIGIGLELFVFGLDERPLFQHVFRPSRPLAENPLPTSCVSFLLHFPCQPFLPCGWFTRQLVFVAWALWS